MSVLREKLAELVAAHPDWDGRIDDLVVFEALPRTFAQRVRL